MRNSDTHSKLIIKPLLFSVLFLLIPITVSAQVPTDRVVDFINSQALQEGVTVSLAEAVAQAESNFNSDAKNASSSASGIYQFTNGTFQSMCIDKYHIANSMTEKNSYTTQTICAIKMIKDGYLGRWDASKTVWSKLAMET